MSDSGALVLVPLNFIDFPLPPPVTVPRLQRIIMTSLWGFLLVSFASFSYLSVVSGRFCLPMRLLRPHLRALGICVDGVLCESARFLWGTNGGSGSPCKRQAAGDEDATVRRAFR